MKSRAILFLGAVLLLGGLLAGLSQMRSFTQATSLTSAIQNEKSKCPVCGMFVDQYAAWMGKISFRDGHLVCFDGAKDLFKYYFDIHRYDPGRTTNQIQSLQVTDYYSVDTIDGYQSHYVIGSDVLGPMGHELIPFGTEQAALEFFRDHQGKRVVTFEEVTKQMTAHLE